MEKQGLEELIHQFAETAQESLEEADQPFVNETLVEICSTYLFLVSHSPPFIVLPVCRHYQTTCQASPHTALFI